MSKRDTPQGKKQPTTRVGGRDNRTGQYVPISEAKDRPATTTRERIPLPGHGDTGRYDYRTSPSGRYQETRREVVTSEKGERVIIYRDARSGAFTSLKSAEEIRKVAKESAAALKRLSKR